MKRLARRILIAVTVGLVVTLVVTAAVVLRSPLSPGVSVDWDEGEDGSVTGAIVTFVQQPLPPLPADASLEDRLARVESLFVRTPVDQPRARRPWSLAVIGNPADGEHSLHVRGWGYERTTLEYGDLPPEITTAGGLTLNVNWAIDSEFSSVVVETGWPFRCFYGVRDSDLLNDRDMGENGLMTIPSWGKPLALDPEREIPYLIRWRGLLGNVVALGAIAFVILFGLPIIRSAVRRRRDCCIRCGYCLRETEERCPECGTPCG